MDGVKPSVLIVSLDTLIPWPTVSFVLYNIQLNVLTHKTELVEFEILIRVRIW